MQPANNAGKADKPGYNGLPLGDENTALLTAMAGSDPADPATAEADAHKTDYAKGLNRDSLKGARLGVARDVVLGTIGQRPDHHVAAVVDLFSRRVVGWSMSATVALLGRHAGDERLAPSRMPSGLTLAEPPRGDT
mgnify:CR=1 FL=1